MRTHPPISNLFDSLAKTVVIPTLAMSLFAEMAHGDTQKHDPHGRRTEERQEMRAREEELKRDKIRLRLKMTEERPPERILFE